jgi:uncharacterized protein (TIGR04255 family)
MATPRGPFDDPPLDEIPLPRTPLVSVLAQVRYPKAPVLASEGGAQQILDRVRKNYPILRQVKNLSIVVDPSGSLAPQASQPSWRLASKDDRWILNVSDDSTSLLTTDYLSREDFCARLDEVFAVVQEIGAVVIYDRIGIRYTNQFSGYALDRIGDLLRGELLGTALVPLGAATQIELTLTDTVFQFSDNSAGLRVRSGLIPPNALVDPAIAPQPQKYWLLDMDSFSELGADFEPPALGSLTRRLATRAYQFFRWTVTDSFLDYYKSIDGRPDAG